GLHHLVAHRHPRDRRRQHRARRLHRRHRPLHHHTNNRLDFFHHRWNATTSAGRHASNFSSHRHLYFHANRHHHRLHLQLVHLLHSRRLPADNLLNALHRLLHGQQHHHRQSHRPRSWPFPRQHRHIRDHHPTRRHPPLQFRQRLHPPRLAVQRLCQPQRHPPATHRRRRARSQQRLVHHSRKYPELHQ